jgi:hypothetical protein
MRAAKVCLRVFAALTAGVTAFFISHGLFTFTAVFWYDKDLGSVRFDLLDGTVGVPFGGLIALVTAYFVYIKLRSRETGKPLFD